MLRLREKGVLVEDLSGSGRGRLRRLRANRAGYQAGRVALAVFASLTGLLLWAGLAGGTQPYETYESTVAGDGPVAQFRFNDPSGSSMLADSAGSYTATNNGITLGGEGPFGGSKSGSFGGEAYASLPSDPLAGASEFTFEAWVDWAGGTVHGRPIFGFGSGATSYMYLTPFGSQADPTLFEIRTSATTAAKVTAPKLAHGAWEYLAVTETSSGTLTLYLNGEQVAQTTGATISPASLGSAPDDYLGRSPVSGEPLFNGSMSNVAFYAKALSASRIKAHYEAGEFPVNTVPPTISGAAKDGETLSAGAGTWTGLAPITFSYQWTRCNASGEDCASIPAATETSYTIPHEDVGSTLRFTVGASNGAGHGSVSSNQTAVVTLAAPTNTVAPAISGLAEQGQLLSVGSASWKGTQPISYAYQWETCNSAGKKCKQIAGATAASYRVLGSQIGDTLRASAKAENVAGSTSATSAATAVITTGPPVNTELPVISGTAKDGQTLSASTGSWAGTEPFSYAYQWELCNGAGEGCTSISGATGSFYGLGPEDVGHTLRIVVTANNSVGSESATSGASAVVTAIPPSIKEPPAISGTARDGQTLSASTGSWNGSPPLSYEYEWKLCNAKGEACTGIPVAASSTYVLGHGDVGDTLRVKVTASNPGGSASSTSAASGVVAALAPSNTAPPLISGTAQDGQTLSASTGTWEGTPTISYAYQWKSCDSAGSGCSDIPGATDATYVLGHGDVGTTLRVMVTATNSVGSVESTSEVSATVAPLAPTNVTVPAISGTAEEGQALTASKGEWEGTPSIGYAYQWQSCNALGEGCLDIPGATGASYQLQASDVGGTVRVLVYAENVAGFVTASSRSSAVVVANAPVSVGAPEIAGTAEDGQLLTVSNGAWEGSPPLSYAYQWETCDSSGSGCEAITDATESSYRVLNSQTGDTLRAVVTATNAVASENANSDATATITTGLPVSVELPEITGTVQDGEALSVSTGVWAGSEPITYSYQWQRCYGSDTNCTSIEGATKAEYVLGHEDVGVTLQVTVTAKNTAGSTAVSSEVGQVTEPMAPVNFAPPEIAGFAQEGAPLSVGSPGEWSGSPEVTFAYQWQDCDGFGAECVPIAGATGSSYEPGPTDVGETVRVEVTATAINRIYSGP